METSGGNQSQDCKDGADYGLDETVTCVIEAPVSSILFIVDSGFPWAPFERLCSLAIAV